jgi:hypothetical protein
MTFPDSSVHAFLEEKLLANFCSRDVRLEFAEREQAEARMGPGLVAMKRPMSQG